MGHPRRGGQASRVDLGFQARTLFERFVVSPSHRRIADRNSGHRFNHRDFYQLSAANNIPFHYLPVGKDNKEKQEQKLMELFQE